MASATKMALFRDLDMSDFTDQTATLYVEKVTQIEKPEALDKAKAAMLLVLSQKLLRWMLDRQGGATNPASPERWAQSTGGPPRSPGEAARLGEALRLSEARCHSLEAAKLAVERERDMLRSQLLGAQHELQAGGGGGGASAAAARASAAAAAARADAAQAALEERNALSDELADARRQLSAQAQSPAMGSNDLMRSPPMGVAHRTPASRSAAVTPSGVSAGVTPTTGSPRVEYGDHRWSGHDLEALNTTVVHVQRVWRGHNAQREFQRLIDDLLNADVAIPPPARPMTPLQKSDRAERRSAGKSRSSAGRSSATKQATERTSSAGRRHLSRKQQSRDKYEVGAPLIQEEEARDVHGLARNAFGF